jgi:hypothetical protein
MSQVRDLLLDLRSRLPARTSNSVTDGEVTGHNGQRCGRRAKGVDLLIVGTAGILLPGPVGSPFLLAGGIALWPAGFRRVEGWFMKIAPTMYETGIQQIEHFLADLERRYPGSVN